MANSTTSSSDDQISQVRDIVTSALADENGDRQYALEEIDRIVNP